MWAGPGDQPTPGPVRGPRPDTPLSPILEDSFPHGRCWVFGSVVCCMMSIFNRNMTSNLGNKNKLINKKQDKQNCCRQEILLYNCIMCVYTECIFVNDLISIYMIIIYGPFYYSTISFDEDMIFFLFLFIYDYMLFSI